MASSQSLLEPGVELEPVECFISEAIRNDLARAPGSRIATRFPPEPNGHLHLGHAKSVVLNFGLAHQFGGTCCLRFDDTNPEKEAQAFVDGALADVRWLGFRPTAVTHASAYMASLYALAQQLIRAGLAFVDDESEETIRQKRGGLHRPGEASAFRERDVETNLRLFEDMRAGRCRDGERVLRAKIDMQSSNMLLRDPVLYRVRHVKHHRLGDAWCVFPTYDFAHGQCDSFERVSHSLCTLEFAEHRPLYEWLQEKLALPRSQQIEFARLNLAFTCLSKRVLVQLVQEAVVAGWDDPRMPTLCGLRRRGVPAAALRVFLLQQGVTRRDTLTKQQVFLKVVLEHLKDAPHAFAILEPLQMRLLNFDQHFRGQEHIEVTYRSASESCARKQRICADLIIDRQDFQEAPDEAWRRLAPGRVVRLKGLGLVRCRAVTVRCGGVISAIDAQLLSPDALDAKACKQLKTIQWLAEADAAPAHLVNFDVLFTREDMSDLPEGTSWRDFLYPRSRKEYLGLVDKCALQLPRETNVQFERLGYYFRDPEDRRGVPVFNLTAPLESEFSAEADRIKRELREQDRLARAAAALRRQRKAEAAARKSAAAAQAADA